MMNVRLTPQELQRFWTFVDKGEGCWKWKGAVRAGYGAFKTHWGTPESTHRLSWMIHYGPIPDGMWVLHKCDNRGCVRPDHLFLGTPRDNAVDMVNKGRAFRHRGENTYNARLTDEKVRKAWEIRKNTGWGCRKIGALLGVSQSSLNCVFRGLTWKHIEPPSEIVESGGNGIRTRGPG